MDTGNIAEIQGWERDPSPSNFGTKGRYAVSEYCQEPMKRESVLQFAPSNLTDLDLNLLTDAKEAQELRQHELQ